MGRPGRKLAASGPKTSGSRLALPMSSATYSPLLMMRPEASLEDVVAFFRTVQAPEEVFLQTVLVNSGKFRFEPDAKRYIDLRGSRNNHSNTLGLADLDRALASGANWGRKFDGAHDAEVLDALDRRVRAAAR